MLARQIKKLFWLNIYQVSQKKCLFMIWAAFSQMNFFLGDFLPSYLNYLWQELNIKERCQHFCRIDFHILKDRKITQGIRWGLIKLRWMELNRWALTGSEIKAATANIFSKFCCFVSIWHNVAYSDSLARISLNWLICVALNTFSFWKAIILAST